MSTRELNKMRSRWDRFGREDPMHYIATRRQPWNEQEFFGSGRDFVNTILDWVGAGVRRGRMLDLGCGLGRTAVNFAEHFDRVDAVDISPVMIEQAQRLNPPTNVHFVVGSGSDLRELDDDRFDLILCALVFQHVRKMALIESYLSEIARVLKPDGVAVIQFDTRRRSPLSLVYEALPDLLAGRRSQRYLRRYRRDPRVLRSSVAEARLHIVTERNPNSANHFLLLSADSVPANIATQPPDAPATAPLPLPQPTGSAIEKPEP